MWNVDISVLHSINRGLCSKYSKDDWGIYSKCSKADSFFALAPNQLIFFRDLWWFVEFIFLEPAFSIFREIDGCKIINLMFVQWLVLWIKVTLCVYMVCTLTRGFAVYAGTCWVWRGVHRFEWRYGGCRKNNSSGCSKWKSWHVLGLKRYAFCCCAQFWDCMFVVSTTFFFQDYFE